MHFFSCQQMNELVGRKCINISNYNGQGKKEPTFAYACCKYLFVAATLVNQSLV